LIQTLFKNCKTYYSYRNSTIGLNLYTINDIENFAIIDSPGDTENNKYLKLFAEKGYAYSKLLIYLIDERKELDSDSLGKNENLKELLKLQKDFKIPLLILLTHFDTHCDEIKKTTVDWRNICEENLEKNKKNLINYINKEIAQSNDFTFNKRDILHIVLVEPKQISDNDIINTVPDDIKKEYNDANDEEKKKILKYINLGMGLNNNEVGEFLTEKGIYRKKELTKKLREKFPNQYHNVFND